MFRQFITDDHAENSIMQTITIAVSAILIAAGLVTAPGLINNARDNNARTDLANVAYAQESLISDSGKYAGSLAEIDQNPSIKLTLSNRSKVNTTSGADCYVVYAKSASGNSYYRTSGSADSYKVDLPWSSTKPSNVPANCSWAASSAEAFGTSVTNLATNPSVESNFAPAFPGFRGYFSGAVSYSTDEAHSGTHSLKTVVTANNPNQPNGFIYQVATAKDPGRYTASAWIKCPVGVQADFGFRVDDRMEGSDPAFTCSGNWERKVIKYDINAGSNDSASGVQFRALGNAPVGSAIYADDFMIEKSNTLHDYFDGSTPGARWTGGANASTSTSFVE
jgi:hypothetical protein